MEIDSLMNALRLHIYIYMYYLLCIYVCIYIYMYYIYIKSKIPLNSFITVKCGISVRIWHNRRRTIKDWWESFSDHKAQKKII